MTTEVAGVYHDGVSTRARSVVLRFGEGGRLRIMGEEVDLELRRAEVRVESRLGNASRFLRLSEDRRVEVRDNDALDAALRSWGHRHRGAEWLHRLEQSWRWVLVSVVVVAVLGSVTYLYGVPWAARRVAFALPERVTTTMTRETLEVFDRTIFGESTLEPERRVELQEKFAAFLTAAGDRRDYRVEFRDGKAMGPNAFALPSGVIVITDQLVRLAESDDEILGVLAHECGHVRQRHILRGVLQNSAVFVVLALATGDVSSATVLGGAIPSMLMQSKFSREFEREADDHAIAVMHAAGLSAQPLAVMLERLEAAHSMRRDDVTERGAGEKILDYISSHPPTSERAKRMREPLVNGDVAGK